MENLPSGLPEKIQDDEDVARYLTSSRQFNSTTVKGVAFLPSIQDRESSVFRHGSEPRERLISIGNEHAAGDRNLHGAAIVKAALVRGFALELLPNEPPPRHAVIKGWPAIPDDPQAELAKHKELANCLASASTLIRF